MSQAFLLSLIIFFSCTQVSSFVSTKLVIKEWLKYKEECHENNSRELPATGLVCNRTFDRFVCWPDGLPNTTVAVPCPWFLPWYAKVQNGLVYMECKAEGQWAKQRNASECEPEPDKTDTQYYGRILSKFRIIYTVGYSLSLGALVLALCILVTFRKLHCMRNNIHMNLFASFILRAVAIFTKDALLEKPHINPGNSTDVEMDMFVINEVSQSDVGCKTAVVMMQYSIIANSHWLLVEGIYLHNLLAVTVLTEGNHFSIYLCIGWGAPLIFVLPWVVIKYTYENESCWEQNTNMGFWWIIRSPILLAVLINFFIFIRIINILVSKLRAHQMRYTDYKFRLAKSTLTLIPLLGSHLVLFSFITDESTSNGAVTLRLTKMFIDLVFNSVQGLLVAILYCFVNKEVQSEIMKFWKRWKGKDIDNDYRHTYSNTAQMTSNKHVQAASSMKRLPDVTCSSMDVCSAEEKQLLTLSCHNGADRLHFTTRSPDGTSSTNSTAAEEPMVCNQDPRGSIESNM
ncbi:glucagon receptor [Clarias gariepinus]|uniref:glucagon receptor n=1 Tax=Clarias gariepinus TaxID=13013 RepID=UPI00234D5482|nr:glucagon receptor [Clarias gariepinus]